MIQSKWWKKGVFLIWTYSASKIKKNLKKFWKQLWKKQGNNKNCDFKKNPTKNDRTKTCENHIMIKQVWWNTRKIQNVPFFSKALFKKPRRAVCSPLWIFWETKNTQCRKHTQNIHTTETWRKSRKIDYRQSWKIINFLSDGTFPYWSLKNNKICPLYNRNVKRISLIKVNNKDIVIFACILPKHKFTL